MLKPLLFSLCLLSARVNAEKLEINLYNSTVLRGEITQASVADIQNKIAALDKKRLFAGASPIYLVLDSPGGDIMAGESLISYLKTVQNVRTVSIFSASMASAIVEAVSGTRYVTEDGTLMFHRAAMSISGQVETGEVESRLAWVKSIVLRMENRNSSRMDMTLADYKARVKDELWMDSAQAIKLKAADKVVDLVCTKSLIEAKETIMVQTFFGTLNLVYSKCPLFRYPTATEVAEENVK